MSGDVPADVIACVDTAPNVAVRVQRNLFFHVLSSGFRAKRSNFLVLSDQLSECTQC